MHLLERKGRVLFWLALSLQVLVITEVVAEEKSILEAPAQVYDPLGKLNSHTCPS